MMWNPWVWDLDFLGVHVNFLTIRVRTAWTWTSIMVNVFSSMHQCIVVEHILGNMCVKMMEHAFLADQIGDHIIKPRYMILILRFLWFVGDLGTRHDCTYIHWLQQVVGWSSKYGVGDLDLAVVPICAWSLHWMDHDGSIDWFIGNKEKLSFFHQTCRGSCHFSCKVFQYPYQISHWVIEDRHRYVCTM